MWIHSIQGVEKSLFSSLWICMRICCNFQIITIGSRTTLFHGTTCSLLTCLLKDYWQQWPWQSTGIWEAFSPNPLSSPVGIFDGILKRLISGSSLLDCPNLFYRAPCTSGLVREFIGCHCYHLIFFKWVILNIMGDWSECGCAGRAWHWDRWGCSLQHCWLQQSGSQEAQKVLDCLTSLLAGLHDSWAKKVHSKAKF